MNEAKEKEYPLNGNSVVKDGNKFMRIAVCNRKVVDVNGRPVYHIDNIQPLKFSLAEYESSKVMQRNQYQHESPVKFMNPYVRPQ